MIEKGVPSFGPCSGGEFFYYYYSFYFFFSRAKIRHSGIINQWPPSVLLKRGWALFSLRQIIKIFVQRSLFLSLSLSLDRRLNRQSDISAPTPSFSFLNFFFEWNDSKNNLAAPSRSFAEVGRLHLEISPLGFTHWRVTVLLISRRPIVDYDL